MDHQPQWDQSFAILVTGGLDAPDIHHLFDHNKPATVSFLSALRNHFSTSSITVDDILGVSEDRFTVINSPFNIPLRLCENIWILSFRLEDVTNISGSRYY